MALNEDEHFDIEMVNVESLQPETDPLQAFLPDWASPNEEKIKEILLDHDKMARTKAAIINNLTGCENGLKNWMTKLAVEEKLPDGWNSDSFNDIMNGLNTMSLNEADQFFDWCRKWVVNKDWPFGFGMHVACKQLEEKFGIKREEQEESPPPSNLGQVKRKSEEERESNWMNKAKEKLEQGIGSSLSLVNPEIQKEIVLSKRNSVCQISTEEKESEKISPKQAKKEGDSPDEDGPKKELTIVLIGGSGCGKTTLINSFNNYFRYSTFNRVQERGVKICIPTRFSWFIDEKQKTIQPKMNKASGDEGNEDLGGGGRSITQEPITHTFRYKGLLGDVHVNFIDTPGMNDTEGDEKDDDHIENIMKYLEKLEKIDAICMVLKPNESKLTYSFRSAINKLLDRLPKTTYSNILFCFTYTNATNFKPAETLPVLRKYFTEMGRNILLEKKNMFCFDNEPFRYLCLVKTYPNEMDETYADTCRKTYDHSVGELTRLIELVEKLPSFKFKNLLPQQARRVTPRLKEGSNISESRKQSVPQFNELSKEPSVYQQMTGLFSIKETKMNQQDTVHRQASPPQDTKKEEAISKKVQAPITSEEFATTYNLNKGGVELFDPNVLATQPSINIYPSPHIAHQIYNNIPGISRVIPTQKVEDNQPGSSTFAKDQNIEEVPFGVDAIKTINTHPIHGLTKERTFDLVQALAKQLAWIVEDNISRSHFLTDNVKYYTTQKEEKEKILYPFCNDCHGRKCPASSFAFGICDACTHHNSKHHYTSSEIEREKVLIDIRNLTSTIDQKKKELAKLETLQEVIQTACVQFSIFRLTQTNHFSATFIDYILDTANKEKRKASMRETSIYQKDLSEIYSLSLKSFVDVFRDRLAKAKSEGYDKEVTQKSVAEQILQLSELEDFKNRLLPIINETIYPNVNHL